MNNERDFPLYPNEVTKEFLSKCFGSNVSSFKLDTSMTAGGVLADAFRVFNIEYEEKQDLPRSCFLKCTKEIPEVDYFFGSNDHTKIMQFLTGKDYAEDDPIFLRSILTPACEAK